MSGHPTFTSVSTGLTGSQRTPGIWGVTAWYQSLGIRIPRELGCGYPSLLGWFDVKLGMRLPRKSQNKTRTMHACVLSDCLINLIMKCDHVDCTNCVHICLVDSIG